MINKLNAKKGVNVTSLVKFCDKIFRDFFILLLVQYLAHGHTRDKHLQWVLLFRRHVAKWLGFVAADHRSWVRILPPAVCCGLGQPTSPLLASLLPGA